MYGKIIVNTIQPQSGITSVTFHDRVAANGDDQWIDRYRIIKANANRILSNATIPAGTNGVTAGQVTIGAGCTVTVKGNWRVV